MHKTDTLKYADERLPTEAAGHILLNTATFIHNAIREDLGADLTRLHTRFPPEPGGFLHIGNAKAVYINFELAKIYGGKCNLRMDDTNPVKEDATFVQAIQDEIRWLGYDWEDRLYFASDYFDKMYGCAVELIEKGLAFVCDMTAEELRAAFGSTDKPGMESPYRGRSVEENLDLFTRMKNGEFADGSKTLRAKIDMASANLNMRDPVIYRIARKTHSNTGDKWCIYPMYDFAHPLEDAIEGITHSLCNVEFEDHRPIYEWYVNNLDCFPKKPRQIEFASLAVTNTIMGKRHIRKLVADGKIGGWDDPRLVTLSGMRRRGYPAAAIREFLGQTGVSKAQSIVEFAMLEHFVREHLKEISQTVMVVLDPVKVVIENFPEGETEMLDMPLFSDEFAGDAPEGSPVSRIVPFSREIYIERDDFMEVPEKKFFRLAPGKEVRLKGAYAITCTDVVKNEAGKITEIRATYDPATKSGSDTTGRKIKGVLHWVSAGHALPIEARLYDTLVTDTPKTEGIIALNPCPESIVLNPNPEATVLNPGPEGITLNPNSQIIMDGALAEPSLATANADGRYQFMRQGYFCLDEKATAEGKANGSSKPVFNRTVGLKSSYKPGK